jgi:hypothetical protein
MVFGVGGMASAATPAGLKAPGRRLWAEIHAAAGDDFELDEREMALLTLAARQVDDIAALEAELRRTGLTVLGSTGQLRVSPIVAELRQARLAVGRLLGQIALPSVGDVEQRTAASMRASHAASSLWAQRQQRDERAAAARRGGRSS